MTWCVCVCVGVEQDRGVAETRSMCSMCRRDELSAEIFPDLPQTTRTVRDPQVSLTHICSDMFVRTITDRTLNPQTQCTTQTSPHTAAHTHDTCEVLSQFTSVKVSI